MCLCSHVHIVHIVLRKCSRPIIMFDRLPDTLSPIPLVGCQCLVIFSPGVGYGGLWIVVHLTSKNGCRANLHLERLTKLVCKDGGGCVCVCVTVCGEDFMYSVDVYPTHSPHTPDRHPHQSQAVVWKHKPSPITNNNIDLPHSTHSHTNPHTHTLTNHQSQTGM